MTRGRGPLFFEIAGIHDNVPNQKRKPPRNHIAADFRSELRRERTSSGVNANATAQTSPIGGKTAQSSSALSAAAPIIRTVSFFNMRHSPLFSRPPLLVPEGDCSNRW